MGLLDDQVAIITGAGTGIGREAALLFADEGAGLVLAGRRIEPLNEVVQIIESKGGTAVARSTETSQVAREDTSTEFASKEEPPEEEPREELIEA